MRIHRKNIRDFRGKPMMQWPIEAAKASGLFDLIVVSTDYSDIAELAHGLGCAVHCRAPDDGTKGTQEIARDVLQDHPEATQACVIYPCSPLLEASDLQMAAAMLGRGLSFVMSISSTGTDAGCFYLGWAEAFGVVPLGDFRTTGIVLPAERCIDINTPEDWARAESMYDALHRL